MHGLFKTLLRPSRSCGAALTVRTARVLSAMRSGIYGLQRASQLRRWHEPIKLHAPGYCCISTCATIAWEAPPGAGAYMTSEMYLLR